MKPNMGTFDRILRVLIAIVVVALYATGHLAGITAILLLVLSGIFVLTSFISFCPLYLPFGISTRPKKDSSAN
jgi:hypothetical protein